MVTPADKKVVPLKELRLKPANSNDAARAVLAHHFDHVPRCSFAKDDGISQYLGSESGMDHAPAAPSPHVALHDDVPSIKSETERGADSKVRKLLRSGFAFSVFLHAVVALALGFAVVSLPEDPSLVEGVTVIAVVVDGDSENNDSSSGAKVEKAIEKPVKIPDPVKPPEEVKPVQPKAEQILKEVPMPVLGAAVPEILTSQIPAKTETEEVDKPEVLEKPEEEKPEEKPIETPKPVEKKLEPKKEEPKKPEKKKEKPKETRKRRGTEGRGLVNTRKGEKNADRKGDTATDNSRGDSDNREKGNASRSNYKGLVEKKLQRAKSRIRAPGKGSVTVAFTITANGGISEIRISRSSGKDAVDATALKIVQRAVPFPAIPAETGRKNWSMSVPITFN